MTSGRRGTVTVNKAVTWVLMIPVKLAAIPLRIANWALELFQEYSKYQKDHRDR